MANEYGYVLPTLSPTTLLSFGYSSDIPVEALETFVRQTNAVIIDVRRTPFSQYSAGYRRDALEKRFDVFSVNSRDLSKTGRYLWAGKVLGNGSTKEEAEASHGGWVIPQPYDLESTIIHLDGMRQMLDGRGARPLYMCGCGKWRECHRRFIIELALAEVYKGWDVHHLWAKDKR